MLNKIIQTKFNKKRSKAKFIFKSQINSNIHRYKLLKTLEIQTYFWELKINNCPLYLYSSRKMKNKNIYNFKVD